jgi:hypothetical protein
MTYVLLGLTCSCRSKILIDSGLGKFDEPAAKIFQYAVQTYRSTDPDNFIEKCNRLEVKYQWIVDGLFKNPELEDPFLEDISLRLEP